MAVRAPAAPPSLEVSVNISATPRVVLDAFFDAPALAKWCGTVQSVTPPRLLGPYALEWPPTGEQGNLFGGLSGVFRGTIMEFEPTRGFFVADAFWLPPDEDPIGPMAMTVSCALCLGSSGRPATRVKMLQGGLEESTRWRRYSDRVGAGWQRALDCLRVLLEASP
jgi:hypothetical protein